MAETAPVHSSSPFQDFGLLHGNDEMDIDDVGGSGQQPLVLEKRFSDDENGFDDLLADSFARPKTRKSPKGKGRKAAHLLSNQNDGAGDDEGDAPQPSLTKKPRILSLFGGGGMEIDDNDDTPPQTPGTGLGVRLSSLNMNQQEGEGEAPDGVSRPNFDLAETLGLREDANSREPSPFREPSPAPSYEEDLIDNDYPTAFQDPVKAYSLRENIDRLGASSTHIDIDRSGNYDPEEEARERILKMRMAKQAKTQAKKLKAAGKGRGKNRRKPEEDVKPKKIAVLKIKAMGSVLNITDGIDNWPDDYSDLDPEDEEWRQTFVKEGLQDWVAPGEEDVPFRQEPIPDPKGELDDLTAHPVARGCKVCRTAGETCSMIADGQYPCHTCSNDELDCHPIVEPAGLTGPCERCKAQGQSCSFEHADREQLEAMCDECLEADNVSCRPGLPREYKTNRVDLDQILYGVNRKKWQSCTHCREGGSNRCSLLTGNLNYSKGEDKPPCKRCINKKLGCHFYPAAPRPKAEPKSRKKKKKENDEEQAEEPAPTLLETIAPEFSVPGHDTFTAEDIEFINGQVPEAAIARPDSGDTYDLLEDTEGHRGFLATIPTSFAHPMKFCTRPTDHPSAVTDCNFCAMPTFGFVGHWERQVAAIQWLNGQGFTEFGNGHRENGVGPTTMCQTCTFHRLQIMSCDEHNLAGVDLEHALDFNAVAEDLMSVEAGSPGMHEQLGRWCSLCFMPAIYRCCTPQPYFGAAEGDEDAQLMQGCGLALCARCQQEFEEVYGRDLDLMAEAFDKEPKPKEDDEIDDEANGTIRADVGLLKMNGLLMKSVNAEMEAGGEGEGQMME